MAFNFTAELNVRLNSGSLRNVQTQLNSSLKGLSVNVDVTVVPRSQSPGEGRVCRLRGTRGCGSPPR